MDDNELKQKVSERMQLKKQRDALLGDISIESISVNPMGILTKMGDLKSAFEITQKIEALSDDIVAELIRLKTGG